MMIGPAPMSRDGFNIGAFGHEMLRASVLRHHVGKAFKQIVRIMGAGRGLGMVLHGKDRQLAMRQTFHRVVVEI